VIAAWPDARYRFRGRRGTAPQAERPEPGSGLVSALIGEHRLNDAALGGPESPIRVAGLIQSPPGSTPEPHSPPHSQPDAPSERASHERQNCLRGPCVNREHHAPTFPVTDGSRRSGGVRLARHLLHVMHTPKHVDATGPDPGKSGNGRSEPLCSRLQSSHALHVRGHRKDVDLSEVQKRPGQARFFGSLSGVRASGASNERHGGTPRTSRCTGRSSGGACRSG
jgi:hypothetical protein